MEDRTYVLFVYGEFDDYEDVQFFYMEVIAKSPCVKTLKYVIENDNDFIVIFDSDYDQQKLSMELLTFMINDTVKYYVVFPLDTMITAHLPEKIKDIIFKPMENSTKISITYIGPEENKNFDLDEVLEKIKKKGLDSLTPEEKKFLDNF